MESYGHGGEGETHCGRVVCGRFLYLDHAVEIFACFKKPQRLTECEHANDIVSVYPL